MVSDEQSCSARRQRLSTSRVDTDNGLKADSEETSGSRAGLDTIRPPQARRGWRCDGVPQRVVHQGLGQAGFDAEVKYVRSRGKKGNRHVIWVAGSRASSGVARARRAVK